MTLFGVVVFGLWTIGSLIGLYLAWNKADDSEAESPELDAAAGEQP